MGLLAFLKPARPSGGRHRSRPWLSPVKPKNVGQRIPGSYVRSRSTGRHSQGARANINSRAIRFQPKPNWWKV